MTTTRHRPGPVLLTTLATALLCALGGCAAPVAPDPPAPPDTTEVAPAPAVSLPWPAAGSAEVADLQDAADGGAQPWLVDPSEVALSYVAAVHDWAGAAASPRPPGPDGDTTVDVRAGADRTVLTLRQPGRTGAGGVWVVTAESRS